MVLKKFAKNFSEICSRPDEGHNERKTIKRGMIKFHHVLGGMKIYVSIF